MKYNVMKGMKNNSIKKALPRLASIMVVLLLVFILPLNFLLQIHMQHTSQQNSTTELFGQMVQLIETNEKEMEQKKSDFKRRCIHSADVVAFVAENYKDIIKSRDEIQDLANKLNLDEIHFLDAQGKIISGTHPEYYEYTLQSGEQMRYFEPMLTDKSLKLCQDIEPNTAQGKEMQYAAVWLSDGSGIVQIGMEPTRLQMEIQEKSLKKIVSNFPFALTGYIHIIDNKTSKIVASTGKNMIGIPVGSDVTEVSDLKVTRVPHQTFKGQSYCVYAQRVGNYTLVRAYLSKRIFDAVLNSSFLVTNYILLGSLGIIMTIRWYIRHKIIANLDDINHELKKIENGIMDNITMYTNVEEFDELVMYLNKMLNSIRLNWDKFSYIMNKPGMPIGVFEMNTFYKKSYVNDRLLEIFLIDPEDGMSDEVKKQLVEQMILQALNYEIDQEDRVYRCDLGMVIKHLRIEKILDDQSIIYYVTDMSPWWDEMAHIKQQSGIDELTKLLNRRGFFDKMDELYSNKNRIKKAAMLLIDADNLKNVNDTLGHAKGDKYINEIAKELEDKAGKQAICSRLGGDEFAIFLYGYETKEQLDYVIQQMQLIRGRSFFQAQLGVMYTLEYSMGVAYYPEDNEDYRILMRLADEQMYKEKKSRKIES